MINIAHITAYHSIIQQQIRNVCKKLLQIKYWYIIFFYTEKCHDEYFQKAHITQHTTYTYTCTSTIKKQVSQSFDLVKKWWVTYFKNNKKPLINTIITFLCWPFRLLSNVFPFSKLQPLKLECLFPWRYMYIFDQLVHFVTFTGKKANTRLTLHFMCGLMSDLAIFKF